jgi:hypothetical protein
MQDFAPFIPELLGVVKGGAIRINLPATSKSIDIPDNPR